MGAALCLAGCKNHGRVSAERSYTEARLQFQQGYTDQAQTNARLGEKNSADFTDIMWKFRILEAEIDIRKDSPKLALELLSSDSRDALSNDILWRRSVIQALASCQLHQDSQTDQFFNTAEHISAGNSALQAEIAYFRGRCEVAKNNLPNAEMYFKQVVEAPAVNSYARTWSLASLGLCEKRQQHYENAIDWYTKAKDAFSAINARPIEQNMLGSLGYLYSELRDTPKARQYTEQAAKMAQELKIPADQQRWLLDLGNIYLNTGEFGTAEESFNKALSIPTPPGDPVISIRCLHGLTTIYLGRGQHDIAEKYHQEASKLGPKNDDLTFWQLDDASIAAGKGQYDPATNLLLSMLQQKQKQDAAHLQADFRMLWLIQSRLAQVYAAQGKDRDADSWFRQSVNTVMQAASTMKHAEFSSAILGNMPVFDEYIAFLVAKGENVKALQLAQTARARTLVQETGPSSQQMDPKLWLARIQMLLRKRNAVLFSYFASQKECYLWAITPTQFRLSKLGISGPELDNLIDDYRKEIRQHAALDNSLAARKLFQILVQPSSDLIAKDSHVIIVADSKIYSMNFETLVAPQGQAHYWIDDVALENASSIDLLLAGNRGGKPAKGMLLIGAALRAGPNFPELPNAPREMESVGRHFSARNMATFSGGEATPEAYFSHTPGDYRYIYFATHGASDPVDAMNSAIILSPDQAGKFKLFARDIVSSKLHLNADLVTISACEGTGTQIQSLEGLIGLEWAFMRAGAHHVVAALWDVDDAITPGLMDDFYGEIEKGKSATDALRHAKLALLHAGGIHAVPYYWAALELYTRS